MVSSVLNFTIKVDPSQAEAGVKRVGSAFKETGGAAAAMAKQFEITDSNAAKVARSLGVELSSGAERAVSKLEGLRDHLTRTGAPAADLQRVTEALAEADKRYAASLTITTQRMGFWQQHGTAIATTAGAMGAAVLAFGAKAVSAFSESQKVTAQLDAVLKSTGGAAGVTKKQVLGLADALSKVTPFDDEVIASGEALLLTFTNIGQETLPRATKAMLDLATATKQDVPSAARMLGKALDQPAEGFAALARTTGKFTEAQVSAIKHMVDMGETSKAQTTILDLLEKKFGGSAEAAGKTFTGQLAIARTEAGNFNEKIGAKLTPTLQGLIKEFPNAAAAAVGLYDAWGSLNISGGELLIAVPLLKNAFAGMGATLAGMVGSAGVIGLAVVGIAALAATIYLAVTALEAFNQQQISAVQANITATRATEGLTKKAQEYGIQLTKGNETQEQFNARLFQAIVAHERLHPAVEKLNRVQKSHVITLQEQIEKQKALVERLKFTEGASEKLTAETAKLDAMVRKSGEGAAKAQQEFEKLQSTFGVKLSPTVRALTEDGTKLIERMQRQGASAGEVEHAMLLVADKIQQASDSTKTLAQRTEDWLGSAELQHAQLMRNVAAIDRMRDATILLADAPDPLISTNETLTAQMHHLDVITEGWDKLHHKIGRTDEVMKPAKQAFSDFGELARRQVSTLVSDVSKGFADIIFSAGSLGSKLVGIFKKIGDGIVQAFFESGIMGLFTGQGLGGFSGFGGGLLRAITGRGGGAAGAASQGLGLAGAGAGLFGAGLFGSAGTAASLVPAGSITGLGALTTGGTAASGGIGGLTAALGAIPVWGWAAIAAAVAAGPVIGMLTQRGRDKKTATGSADPNNLSGAEGLSYQVWKQIIPDVKAGNLSINEGIAAVNAAWASYEQFLRANVKDSVVIQRSLDTQRGTLTQSLAELEAMRTQLGTEGMADLRGFLDEMARTGTVTDDAIAGLTGVVEKMQQAGLTAETSAAKLGLLGAQFFRTGQITDEFAAALTAAGGSAEFFTQMTGQIQHLQGLRSELGSLKQMIDSLIPKTKTWQEEFFETGKITDAMAQKIVEAGGDIRQFKQFADMKSVKTQFQSLMDEFNRTGKVSDELLEKIRMYGDKETTQAFERLMAESRETGKSFGELAKESESKAKIIQTAFDSTGANIENAFTNAAKTLSDTLAKMDENLGKAIGSLQAAMTTMIMDLINVILGVPGAAEKAATDFNFFMGQLKSPVVKVDVDLSAAQSAVSNFFNGINGQAAAFGGNDYFKGNVIPGNTGGRRGMASGGIITEPYLLTNPRTGRVEGQIGEAGPEAVVPIRRNGSGTTGGGNTYYVSIDKVVTDDPEALMEAVTRMADTNQSGSRVKLLKAMRLRETGAF